MIRDWGSGHETWRRSDGELTIHRLTNREVKKAWFSGESIKAY